MTFSPVQLVIDNEMLGIIGRILKGVIVNERTIPIDLIATVGRKGNYLSEMHTVDHFREELHVAKLLDRGGWDEWKASGSLSLRNRAHRQAVNFTREHVPEPLSEYKRRELAKVVDSAQSISYKLNYPGQRTARRCGRRWAAPGCRPI